MKDIYILGIESSCDDTSAAVLKNGVLLSNVTASQEVHKAYGGVVPELASRAHQQNVVPVVDQAIARAGIKKEDLSAVAFTRGPGLMGSLLVGVSFAKGFARSLNIPMIDVNHLQGHVMAHFIKESDDDQSAPPFPFICLLVSGGNSQIVKVNAYNDMEVLGQTIDDAAGEAIDKCAKVLEWGYPGGPVVDKYARQGNPKAFSFSEPHIPGLNYSFSGFKTSFLYSLRKWVAADPDFVEKNKYDLAASIEFTIVDILMKKLRMAVKQTGIKHVAVAGGVSANNGLRNAFHDHAKRLGLEDAVLRNFLTGKTHDWYDQTFRTGINQDYNASVSGASERMSYYMSFGYQKNEGAVKGNDYSAMRANLKVSGKVTDWLEIGANVNFQDRTDGDIAVSLGTNYWDANMLRNSPYSDYTNEDGSLVQYPMGSTVKRGYNYEFDRQYLDLDKGYTVLNTIFNAKVKLPFNITYDFNIAPRYEFFHNCYFMSAELPDSSPTSRGVDREHSKRFDYSLNNTITWDHTFAEKHHVILTLVQEAEERRYWNDKIEARNILPSDALGFHNTQNGTKDNSNFKTNDTHETAANIAIILKARKGGSEIAPNPIPAIAAKKPSERISSATILN